MHKPRTRLLRDYEPDPVPPPTACAKAQRPPPAEGKAVTASPRDGRGTADEGPRGQQVRKRRPQQPAQLGYSTRTPTGMGNRTGPSRANPPVYIPPGEPRDPPNFPRRCPLQHAGTSPPTPVGADLMPARPLPPCGRPEAVRLRPLAPRHASTILGRSRPFGPRPPAPRLAQGCQGSPRSPLQAPATA